MKLKLILIGLFLGLLLTIMISLWYENPLSAAPDVLFTTITGKKIALKDLQGQVVLVTFWATDCKSCIEEVPHFVELYDAYHPQGLEIIAVAMYYDPPSHVVKMTQLKQIPYDVALDLRAEHARAFGNVQLTPTTFLIDSEGLIHFKKIGLFDKQLLEKRIQKLLDKVKFIK